MPSELLNKNGILSIGVFGIKENYRIVSNWVHYKMENGCYTDGRDPIDPESTIYEQIMESISTKQNKLIGGTGIKISNDTISIDPFVVTVTHDSDTDIYSTDKTFVEIMSAIKSGQNALLVSDDRFYNMVYASESEGEIVFRYLSIGDSGQFIINFVIYDDDTVYHYVVDIPTQVETIIKDSKTIKETVSSQVKNLVPIEVEKSTLEIKQELTKLSSDLEWKQLI